MALAVCWAAGARLNRAQWLEPKAATERIVPCASWSATLATACLVASYPTLHSMYNATRTLTQYAKHMRAGIMSTANSAVAPQPILGSIRTHRRLRNLFVSHAFLEFFLRLVLCGTSPQAYLTTRTQMTS